MAPPWLYTSDNYVIERMHELVLSGGKWVESRDLYLQAGRNFKKFRQDIFPSDRRPYPGEPLYMFATNRGPGLTDEVECQYEQRHVPWYVVPGSHPLLIREHDYYEQRLPQGPVHLQSPLSVNTMHLLRVRGESDDYSQALAEVDRAADGFVDTAKSVSRIWKRIRGKSKKKLTSCDVSSARLGTEFGIKPVCQDMQDTVDRLIRHETQRTVRIVTSRPYQGNTTNGTETYSCTGRQRLITHVMLSSIAGNRINLGNPAEWAWERIPYSFVVDWMFNVGDTISAFGAGRGLTHRKTVKIERSQSRLASFPPVNGNVVTRGAKAWSKRYQRTVMDDLPLPGRVEFSPTDSLKALGNAFALLNAVSSRCSGKGYRSPARY